MFLARVRLGLGQLHGTQVVWGHFLPELRWEGWEDLSVMEEHIQAHRHAGSIWGVWRLGGSTLGKMGTAPALESNGLHFKPQLCHDHWLL